MSGMTHTILDTEVEHVCKKVDLSILKNRAYPAMRHLGFTQSMKV